MDKTKAKPITPGMKMLMDGGGATSFFKKLIPLKAQPAPKLGTTVTPEGASSPVALVQARALPVLGQTQQPGAPAELPQPQQEQPLRKCPGPVALPDGRILEPGDYLRLEDLCEIMPYLLNAMKSSAGVGQQVRVAGGIPGVQGVPTPSMFGGAGGPLGPYGTGAPAGGFSGGGGGVGPRGPAGPPGPAGADGASVLISDIANGINKIDGDFTVAAGPFVAVPGTTVNFTTDIAGPILVLIQAELTLGGGGSSQNGQIGVRIDGVDYGLARRCIHLFAGGTAEWMLGQSQMFWMVLPAGSHTLDILLRGLTAGEYGVGIGTPATISASNDSPLQVVVLHG